MLLDIGDTFMILATKIGLPTVDVVTDILSVKKVLSFSNDPKWEHFDAYANIRNWYDPRIRCHGCRRDPFTYEDWTSFTDWQRARFMEKNSGGNYREYQALYPFAYVMTGVIVLSWLLTLPHYFRIEKTLRQKLKALPFLLFCSWPQYRGCRLIWLAHFVKDKEKFESEKREFEHTLSHVGKLCHIGLFSSSVLSSLYSLTF